MSNIADTYIPYGNYGQALSETQSFGINTLFFDGPDVVTESEAIATAHVGDVIPAYTVVSRGSGGIQPSVQGDGLPLAGILTADYNGAISTLHVTPIFRTGKFNIRALNWDASFTTDAQKWALFEASPVLFLGIIKQPSV